MKNLNCLEVINVEVNIEHGFFFVEFNNSKSLQCCLKYDENEQMFLNQIERRDSGFDEGLCADCNDWALADIDGCDVLGFLIGEAKKAGVEIV